MSAPSSLSNPPVEGDPVASVCFLLAELLSREVDDSLVGILRLPEFRVLVDSVTGEGEPGVDAPFGPARLEEHAVEFCRLFIYPALCPPRAEHWAREYEEEHFSVLRWFEDEAGVPEFAPSIAELAPTHLAKILYVRAGLAGASSELIANYEAQMIKPWAVPFANALEKQSRLFIYRCTATLLRILG